MRNQFDRAYDREDPIPRDLRAVSAEWLTQMLQHRYGGLVAEDMKVEQLINSHTTKLRVRVRWTGVDYGLPRNLCLKANWSEGFESADICEMEARFYHNFAEKGLVPGATSYYSDWDGGGSGRGFVAMEDLAVTPGRFGHGSQHIGVSEVAQALGSLAGVHGSLWGHAALNQHSWLQPLMGTPIDTDLFTFMRPWIEKNLENPEYQAVLPHWLIEQPERFAHAYAGLVRVEAAQSSPLCVVHGDAHLGNSFVRDNGERIWLDWQMVRKGRPWRDVTYFMIGTLTTEERRSNERHLLDHYRDSLLATGAVAVPSRDEIWHQYRHWPVQGLMSWLCNSDVWGQPGLPMIKRFCAAAEDLETFKLLPPT